MPATKTAFQTLTFTKKTGWAAPFPAADSPQTLVLAFAASEFADTPQPLADLRAAFPSSCIVGCSTSGEIHGDHLSDSSISIAVMPFQHTRLGMASAPARSAADSFHAGDSIARQLQGPGLKAVFILSDGLNINGSELIRGLSSVLPPSVIVTGGLAGDGDRFKRTWVLRNGEPTSGFVTAVGLYGERIRVGHGSRGGWDVFGPERTITRSAANILHELDGRPALPLYKQYLGELASGLPSTALLFPLAIRSSKADSKTLVRTVLGVDEATGSMTFAGDVPQGSLAQLMRANFDRLISAASDSARCASSPQGPCLAVAISCVGRRLILGARTEEEIESALDSLPQGSSLVGFYSYGEISPYASGACDLHNQTMTLTTFSEA